MIKTNANPGEIISLGICGENNARQIAFDISDWLDTYGPGTAYLVARRSGDVAPYPAVVEQDGSSVTWTLTSADTGKSGHGQAELVYTIGGTIVKSRVWDTYTAEAITDNTETPPEAASGWVEQVLAAGAQAEKAAADAKEVSEKIRDIQEQVDRVDAGVSAAEQAANAAERSRTGAEEAKSAAADSKVAAETAAENAAASGMVLCDGDSMTSVGGRVTLPSVAKQSDWLEMTPHDAAALIEKNHQETEQVEDRAIATRKGWTIVT